MPILPVSVLLAFAGIAIGLLWIGIISFLWIGAIGFVAIILLTICHWIYTSLLHRRHGTAGLSPSDIHNYVAENATIPDGYEIYTVNDLSEASLGTLLRTVTSPIGRAIWKFAHSPDHAFIYGSGVRRAGGDCIFLLVVTYDKVTRIVRLIPDPGYWEDSRMKVAFSSFDPNKAIGHIPQEIHQWETEQLAALQRRQAMERYEQSVEQDQQARAARKISKLKGRLKT